jgi:hypothetical protein
MCRRACGVPAAGGARALLPWPCLISTLSHLHVSMRFRLNKSSLFHNGDRADQGYFAPLSARGAEPPNQEGDKKPRRAWPGLPLFKKLSNGGRGSSAAKLGQEPVAVNRAHTATRLFHAVRNVVDLVWLFLPQGTHYGSTLNCSIYFLHF